MSLDLPADAADQPYCWLMTTGRTTGRRHTVELWFGLRDGTVYALSGGGERADWVRNATADPAVRVRLASGTHDAVARRVTDADEELVARRVIAAKYQAWQEGRPMSRWAATALAMAFDLVPASMPVTRELQVARPARDRLRLEAALFALRGDLELPDPLTARRVALGVSQSSDRAVDAGDLFAAGMLHEIAHVLAEVVRARDRDAFARALARAREEAGRDASESALRAFIDRFPPSDVYGGAAGAAEWLKEETAGQPNTEVAIEELLLNAVAGDNPALRPFAELLDAGPLAMDPHYRAVRAALEEALDGDEGPGDEGFLEMLRAPVRAAPDSLAGQLVYIRERWGHLVGERLDRVLLALDLLREDETARRIRWLGAHGGAGAPTSAPELRGLGEDAERFSTDRDWMPSVVLMAKNALVWLDQLSRRYERDIRRLDQIPDEELAALGARGFTGLWLIGVWQRSDASARIKQMRGNPEAAASAYALHDYRIADDLGGDEALDRLREQAARHGLRLSSDMVPNHMAIDSRWLIERPELFISVGESPFPAYRFTGPDLSPDGRVGIQIDDGYWDGTDAAVVFRREDRSTGDVRYVYHGNDGTSTPWNDTAQLDFLRPETREAVAATIIDVCRRFPIVRFDAAMVLAKRHFRRLWYPEPGSGGAIPSRAEHALRAAEFEAAMPTEFWREVVDRVAVEAPDTLLLAEAFWLLEGYFVRTLGMHRVYNSAFMNMLRDERNADYRKVLRETLEFDPEILKRYVNFMSNPDERTAVDQFGTGDKYFAVATLLATLPGLPMFGHGQLEGFTEKYGMEYRRAYHDEPVDQGLLDRHEREIFPLLRRRWLFAEARDFVLYDAVTDDGAVDEDVFAYSNRADGERALVVVHNRFASARVRLRGVVTALGLASGDDRFVCFRDHVSGLEYLRPTADLLGDGMRVELDAFGRHVFLDWREMGDSAERPYGRLHDELGGRGVPNVEAEMDALLARDRPTPAARAGVPDAATLLERERAAWAAWQAFVERYGRDAVRDDGWRMRDVIAHVAAWNRAAAHAFAAMAAGETEWDWPSDTDAFNAEVRAQWAARPWRELQRESRDAHDEFVAAVGLLDAELLEANDGLAAGAVAENGFEHYEGHMAEEFVAADAAETGPGRGA